MSIRRRRWTAREQRLFMELWPSHSNRELAEILGRTAKAVMWRANAFGLHKTAKAKSQLYSRVMLRQPRGIALRGLSL